jgi:beta-mannosidase
MRGKGVSRRDCLSFLGAGAVAAVTPAVAQKKASLAGPSPHEQLGEPAKVALQSEMEELKELGAQRVYAPTPVQSRPEYVVSADASGGQEINLRDEWELTGAHETDPPGQYSSNARWIKTEMPCPVQSALMEAGEVPNLWIGENFKKLQWIQQRDWYLRRKFVVPESWRDGVIRLRFDGMDYYGMVWLDGEFLGGHEGAFGGPTFDISSKIVPGKQHELLVRLVHEPHDLLPNFDSSSENHNPRVVKPDAQDAESYQWGNRYRTIGLYQPIRLIGTGQAYMEAPFVRTDSIGPNSAALWGQAMLTNAGDIFDGVIEAQIVDATSQQLVWQQQYRQKVPSGNSFWETEIELKNPRLWWPNGMGEQPLYRLELKLLKDGKQFDFITSRFGVRTLELKRNPSYPESPRATPSDRTLEDEAYRYLWVANGRSFYVNGACWMTSDDVLSLSAEREEWMVRAAKLSGYNMLRLNGGTSIFETEQFYNLCDENGLFVWQEVPLNWTDTPGTTTLPVWREQLTQNVLRLRQHPSTAIYVGGNEFDPFADGIEPLIGLIREIFAGYDGGRPFRMNSPCGGDYHAYEPPDGLYSGDENWYHKIFDRGHNFFSEWSFSSFANYSLLKRIIPSAELEQGPVGYDVEVFKRRYPTIRDRSAELWYTFIKSWQRATWYGDFGKANVEELIDCSQMAYEHNIGSVLEHWRAQFPYTGGQALWTYNSLGPIAFSWHLIDWFGQPQIPFYAAKRANEPIHIMADTGFYSWGPGDTFKASVFALNDGENVMQGMRVRARIFDDKLEVVHEKEWTTDVPANNRASESHEIEWPIPSNTPEGYLFFELSLADSQGNLRSRRMYWLRILKMLADPEARKRWQAAPAAEAVNQRGPWLKPQVQALPTSLRATAKLESQSKKEAEISVTVQNTGKLPAYPVRAELQPDHYSVLWSDNFFWLAPGETATLRGTVRLDMTGLDPITKPPVASKSDPAIRVSAWNAPAIDLRLR